MGVLLSKQGRLDEAEALYREALGGNRRVLGDEHPSTLRVVSYMGLLYQRRGKLDEAEALFREALEARRLVLGDEHPETLNSICNLGELLEKLIAAERLEDDRGSLGLHLAELGSLELLQGDAVEAASSLAEGFELLMEVHGEDDWRVMAAVGALGAAITGQGRFAEAEIMLLESSEWMLAKRPLSADERWLGADPVSLAVRREAEFYEAWHTAAPGAGYDGLAAGWREELSKLEQERGR